MNMMPQCFGKTNRYKVPHVGVWFVTIAILVCGYISQDSSERISFLIQVGSVFWMLSYIVAHIDLLVFRKRLPHAPRNFKVPGGLVLPLIGISGIVYMICNISTDFHTRMMIYLATGVTFAALSVWSVLWIKLRMKMPLMKPVKSWRWKIRCSTRSGGTRAFAGEGGKHGSYSKSSDTGRESCGKECDVYLRWPGADRI